jgi:hypothetical protein
MFRSQHKFEGVYGGLASDLPRIFSALPALSQRSEIELA